MHFDLGSSGFFLEDFSFGVMLTPWTQFQSQFISGKYELVLILFLPLPTPGVLDIQSLGILFSLFLRGPFSFMDSLNIFSFVLFRSKGEAKALFLRHEGFLGALGAFVSYEKHGFNDSMVHQLVHQSPISSSHGGYKIHGSSNGDLKDNESIECSVYLS